MYYIVFLLLITLCYEISFNHSLKNVRTTVVLVSELCSKNVTVISLPPKV